MSNDEHFDSTDDEALLKSYYDNVKPIKAKKRAIDTARSAISETQVSERRRLATEHQNIDVNPLTYQIHEFVGPHDIISFKQSGVQDGVYRKLRLGKYPRVAKLDLHRKTVDDARSFVYNFISKAYKNNQRCVMITHGKGGQFDEKSVIKSHCNVWLRQLSTVLAFHSCQPPDGGAGAVYVLIKKNKSQSTPDSHKTL